jgi:putative secretion ATPase (PEP-CTERM system associated)
MYETYYGLDAKPFQLNPDPSFFFGSRGHRRAFAYLQYGLFQGEGFIVITGEVGAGKTTLVRSLLEQLDPGKVIAAQLVSTQLDAEDMLRAVAAAFGLPIRATQKAELLATLEAFLCREMQERRRALLVVDEAQNLSPRAIEELRMLSNFQFGDRALLQSFLVGQPELRTLMQSREMQQLRQRVIASYHLGPMDRQETQAYVEHRLTRVGWREDPGFEPAAFDAIYGASSGLPRRINTVCNRVLLAAYLAEKHLIAAADVDAVADEMQRELGPDGGLSSAAGGAHKAYPGAHAGAHAPLHAAGGAEGIAGLEERMRRLERTMTATVDLLHQLLHKEEQPLPRDGTQP